MRPTNSAAADSAHTTPTAIKLLRGDRKVRMPRVSSRRLFGVENSGMVLLNGIEVAGVDCSTLIGEPTAIILE